MRRMSWILVVLSSLALAHPAMAAPEGGADGAETEEPTDTDSDVEAEGVEAADAAVTGEAEEDDFPIGVSLSLGGSFGAATVLSDSEFTQRDYFLSTIGLGLSYSPIDKLSLSLRSGYSKYLTADGVNSQYEGRLQDTSLSASYASIYKDQDYTGINLSGGISFSFPTSDFSQASGLYTRISPSLSLSRSFGGLSLSYSFGATKYFHEYTSVVLDANELDVIARSGGNEDIADGLVALGGVLPSYSISNSFSASFAFLQRFNASLSLSYSDVWTYDNGTITQDDEFVAENAVVGRGHSQIVSGSFGLGVSFLDHFSAGVRATTSSPPLASDNQSLRFPFWDFESPQASRTGLSMSLSASY